MKSVCRVVGWTLLLGGLGIAGGYYVYFLTAVLKKSGDHISNLDIILPAIVPFIAGSILGLLLITMGRQSTIPVPKERGSGATMNRIGFALIALGCLWGIYAFNMSTTVTTEGKIEWVGDSPIHVPSRTVHNIGLLEERRNYLTMAGVMILCGVVLFCFGTLQASKEFSASESSPGVQKICPACAEVIKLEALKCKHCGEVFDPAVVEKQILEHKEKSRRV